MSTNKFASLRNIKAIVPASAMSGGCAINTSQAAPLCLWATRPSGAAKQHAVPPTAATPRAVSVISRRSSSKSFFRGSSGNKSFSWSKPSSHEARRRREVKDETAANNPLLNDDTAELADHLADVKPLDFDMASRIEGQESQMVSFELEPGQVVRVRAGRTAPLLTFYQLVYRRGTRCCCTTRYGTVRYGSVCGTGRRLALVW